MGCSLGGGVSPRNIESSVEKRRRGRSIRGKVPLEWVADAKTETKGGEGILVFL